MATQSDQTTRTYNEIKKQPLAVFWPTDLILTMYSRTTKAKLWEIPHSESPIIHSVGPVGEI